MAQINVLSKETIDKIAAGEVVERPASVVKELLENAVDAGATAVTAEIKEGGIAFIRVTDNGCGIERTQVPKAFLRHATSKINTAEDLSHIVSLGFRGEALSSIAAVARLELITKTGGELTGLRYRIEGGQEIESEEIGAPDGTTLLVRNLFFNTPVRKKFLKQPQTEGGYISDLMEHMAMANPKVSFQYINNGQTRFHTSGNGNLQEIIYRIYGRDIASALIPIDVTENGIHMSGFLGKPEINRANRNFEIYFVNGRFIKSNVIGKAIEEGYRKYVMQHKFPFVVLHFQIDAEDIDVNVHPTKMEVRFTNQPRLFDFISHYVGQSLHRTELIPEVALTGRGGKKEAEKKDGKTQAGILPEPFETKRAAKESVAYFTDAGSAAAGKVVAEEGFYGVAEGAEAMEGKGGGTAVKVSPLEENMGESKFQALGQSGFQPLRQTGESLGQSVIQPMGQSEETIGQSMFRPMGQSGETIKQSVLQPKGQSGETIGQSVLQPKGQSGENMRQSAVQFMGKSGKTMGQPMVQPLGQSSEISMGQCEDQFQFTASPTGEAMDGQDGGMEQEPFFVDNRILPGREEASRDLGTVQDALQGNRPPQVYGMESSKGALGHAVNHANVLKASEHIFVEKPVQLNFFEEKMLTEEARADYRILGQIFDTYWLVAFHDKLFIIDQHAAHEKVKYESFMKHLEESSVESQMLNPPVIITLAGKEEAVLKESLEVFSAMGFEIEAFGGNEYALRSVPTELYGCSESGLFTEILDELAEGGSKGAPAVVRQRIATMACKAAVKGNTSFDRAGIEALIDQLLALEDPYHCPHGRPTIISMSKYEIEKKFKRIV